jgi:hypothetical protein
MSQYLLLLLSELTGNIRWLNLKSLALMAPFLVPVKPKQSQMITVNSTVLTIWLDSWVDGGCAILYFIVEFRDGRSADWTLSSNNVQPTERVYNIVDLVPATKYNLRVTAHNNAGSTVAVYNFTTLTSEGGTCCAWGSGKLVQKTSKE